MRPDGFVVLLDCRGDLHSGSNLNLGKFESLYAFTKAQMQIGSIAGVESVFMMEFWSWNWIFLDADSGCIFGYAFITASAMAKVSQCLQPMLVRNSGLWNKWRSSLANRHDFGGCKYFWSCFGARLAIKGGSTLVRKVFSFVTVALIVKVGIATF